MHLLLISLVGNDPGAVALAAKYLRKNTPRGTHLHTLLVQDGSQNVPLREARLSALQHWLQQEGFSVQVRESLEAALNESADFPGRVVLNLTAGDKASFFRFYQSAKKHGWEALVIDAHGPEAVVTTLALKPLPLSKDEYLHLQDYKSLYFVPAQARLIGVANEVPPGLRGYVWHQLRTAQGMDVLLAIQGNRPLLYFPGSGKNFKDRLNVIAQTARELAGQLALPITNFPEHQVRKAHANNQEYLRRIYTQQAKESRVHLVYPRKPGNLQEGLQVPEGHTAVEKVLRPFPLPRKGPVLLALMGEQPVPLLASFLAHQPKEVYLVTTQALEAQLERLAHAQRELEKLGARVHIRTVEGPFAADTIQRLFKPVVGAAEAKGLPLVVNLNGGTKLMALGLLQALTTQATVEYLHGKELKPLPDGPPLSVPWDSITPQQVLGLFGYRLETPSTLGKPYPDPKVLSLAEALLGQPENRGLAKNFLQAWVESFGANPRSFRRRLQKSPLETALGLALEYAVYSHLDAFLRRHKGGAAPGGNLVPISWKEQGPREVDGVAWIRGRLVILECKPSLQTALGLEREDASLGVLREMFGGVFGGGVLVVRRGTWAPHETPPARLRSTLADRTLRIFSLEGRTHFPEGTVWHFPHDLDAALKGWL